MRPGRLPFQPLDTLVGGDSTKDTARVLGVHARQIYRWREVGISHWRADELAISVGLHPAEIWPEWAGVPA